MKVFFFQKCYFEETHKNISLVRQAHLLFGRENILTFDEAIKTRESLFSPEAVLTRPSGYNIEQIDILRKMADYPAPIVSVFRFMGKLIANDFRVEFARCFDFLYAYNPNVVPFPAEKWYQKIPEVTSRNKSWADREYDTCFVGTPCPRKSFNLIAAVLEDYPNAIIAIAPSGITAAPVYRKCKEWAIDVLRNPPREEINRIFNSTKFLLYPTFSGHQNFNVLQHAPLEAYTCGCAPVLHSAWCSSVFKGYPAQIASIQDVRNLKLTQTLWEDSLSFLDKIKPVETACRTSDFMRNMIFNRKYIVDSFRARRCMQLVRHLKSNAHIFPVSYKRGPFYKVTVNKTMDYKEVEYAQAIATR